MNALNWGASEPPLPEVAIGPLGTMPPRRTVCLGCSGLPEMLEAWRESQRRTGNQSMPPLWLARRYHRLLTNQHAFAALRALEDALLAR